MFTDMKYEKDLDILIGLLAKSGEDHWARYFNDALTKYREGKTSSSYKHVLGAYGGMGSFNDIVLNFISNEEISKIESIRESLWLYCKEHKTTF